MRRREFIGIVGGAAVAWPLAARAQQSKVIGLLSSTSHDDNISLLEALRGGLATGNYAEGRNVVVEYRWAEGRYERLPELAADLVRRRVDIILALDGTAAALAAKAATSIIPIVFAIGQDPIGSGLVASLSRPGGNITGIAQLTVELLPKRLEILHEAVPTAALVGYLRNPNNPNMLETNAEAQAAAGFEGFNLSILYAGTEQEIGAAFAKFVDQKVGAVLVNPDPFLNNRVDQLVALAAKYNLPTIYGWREFATAGGLMSYGTSATDARRQMGIYAGRILKGEKAADLPVQQSTKVELIINLRTAKALGLSMPTGLLVRADEVIE